MSVYDISGTAMENSLTVISACYALTDQYRSVLIELGKEHNLSENEMLVLVHLGMNPDACTQKKLQATQLNLSVSSICRMVDHLRKKEYLTTELDENDRRSWIIHVEQRGKDLTEQFRIRLHQRIEGIFSAVPELDFERFVSVMARAGDVAQHASGTALESVS